MALAHIAVVVGAVLAALVYLPWETRLIYEFPPVPESNTPSGPLDTPAYTRQVVHFTSHGTRCEAWLYLPKGISKPPVVIMAHGLGAQKDTSLPAYAETFASNGMAVFVFDYRNFGGSDGEPRHWASPKRHVEDWFASYNYVQSTGVGGKVDTSRIALWGTSFAGGHVLVLASRLGTNITAVVSQIPHLSSIHAARQRIMSKGLAFALRLLAAGAHDRLRSLLGQGPAYLRLTGRKGDLVLMEFTDRELDMYIARRRQNGQERWQPTVLARLMLEMTTYNPITLVPGIQVPVLLVAGEHDTVCPPQLVEEAAAKLGDRATLVRRASTHFGIYHGEHLHEVSAQMTAFLSTHFKLSGGAAVPAKAAAPAAASGIGGSSSSSSGAAAEPQPADLSSQGGSTADAA